MRIAKGPDLRSVVVIFTEYEADAEEGRVGYEDSLSEEVTVIIQTPKKIDLTCAHPNQPNVRLTINTATRIESGTATNSPASKNRDSLSLNIRCALCILR